VAYRARQVLTFVIILSCGGRAIAGDNAEQLIKKGLEARKRGDDLGALPLFEQAYKLSPTPRAAAQRGFCEQALGRWADAEVHLEEALKSPDDAWVKKNRGPIQASLTTAKAKVAIIEVTGEPSGGEVIVNGAIVGHLPLEGPMRVDAGEIEVEVRSAGYQRASKSLRLGGGQYQRVVLRAEREPPPSAATPPAPGAPPAPVHDVNLTINTPGAGAPTTFNGTPAAATITHRSEGPSTARLAAKWVTWGLGAVSLGVGIYGFSHHESLVKDFNNGCGFDPATGAAVPTPDTTDKPRTDAECRGIKNDYDTATKIGIAGSVGAGLFAVGGLILYLTEPSGNGTSGETRTAFSCAPRLGAAGQISFGCALPF
jgi:hypothetical protein